MVSGPGKNKPVPGSVSVPAIRALPGKTPQNPSFHFLWKIDLFCVLFAEIRAETPSPIGRQSPFCRGFFRHLVYLVLVPRPCRNANMGLFFSGEEIKKMDFQILK
jgi:hypothetical protein